jgi:putative Holliday junction resolvase
MRYLGIDYGTKKVGLATADDDAKIAIPKSVIPNDKSLLDAVNRVIQDGEVDAVVIGESKNYKSEDNLVMKDIRYFARKLKEGTSISIHFEPEFLTSKGAEHIQENKKMDDASAAALILQSYLDKLRINK